MAQGGGMTANMQEKTTRAPIKTKQEMVLQIHEVLWRWPVLSNPDSATSQFYVADNNFLNRSPGNPICRFGKVVKGMDVVDRIVQAPTSNYGMHQNVPKQPIKIVDIKIKILKNKLFI